MSNDTNGEPTAVSEEYGEWNRTQTPSRRVVETVARALDQSPANVDPLAETIDPDALDALFVRPYSSASSSVSTVSFEYGGVSVTVTGDGTVSVVPPADSSDQSGTDEG